MMKKLFFMLIALIAFVFAGTGEIKEINDVLKKQVTEKPSVD